MKKLIFISLLILSVFSVTLVNAHSEEEFANAEKLISSKVSCSNLTNDDLEIIGDYYMEQMHPGELHEIMDERMGGEGSESLRQVHINIAKSFYCGESSVIGPGMMNNLMGRNLAYNSGGMMGQGQYYNNYSNSQDISNILLLISIISVIFIFVIITLALIIVNKNKYRRK